MLGKRCKRNSKLEGLMINDSLVQLCKYQQSVIDRYKEFIENTICTKIVETNTLYNDPLTLSSSYFKEYLIPQTKFILNCSPDIMQLWKSLEFETQTVSPEYFIQMSIKEMLERDEERNE